MVKILHAADFHLDSPFSGLTEEKARQRRRECRELVSRLVDYANSQGVELMLLCGDLFDSRRVYAQTTEELSAALGRFRGQVVITPGNHDPWSRHSPYARQNWPENVHIFREEGLERVDFPQYGCAVYGAAFTAEEAPPLELTESLVREGEVTLLAIHGEVTGGSSRYRAIHPRVLERSGVDYAALGHVHACSGVQYAGKTAYAYCGCPEGRGFDELDEKGFLVGEVGEGKVELRFVPFARRQYRQIAVDVTGRDACAAAQEALSGAAEDICRLVLTGERGDDTDVPMLEERLSPLVWQLEIRDRRREAENIWSRCGEDSLRGLFLARLREEYNGADEERKRIIEQAVRYGLAAMENREM